MIRKRMTLLAFGGIVFLASVFLILVFSSDVSNFEDCVEKGNLVMGSYPRKCMDSKSGLVFIEEVEDYWRFDNINLMQHEIDKTYGCFGFGGSKKKLMCVDPIKEMKLVEETSMRYCNFDFEVIENSETFNCQESREIFDDAVIRSSLPIIEDNNSLCHGLYIGSNFSDLEPLWGVGTLIDINEGRLVFEGDSESIPMMIRRGDVYYYQIGESYEVDMNNLCREFFVLVDSRFESPIIETLVSPKLTEC